MINTLMKFLQTLYGDTQNIPSGELQRYKTILDTFTEAFGKEQCFLINVPGRIEVSGNHTDHNHGKVLAGSINMDAAAICSKSGDNRVVLHDITYRQILTVDLGDLDVRNEETGSPESLIRGVAKGLRLRGYETGGFYGVIHNTVMSGSGLSSSAVFEVVIGSVFNVLFNDSKIDPVELAKTGQYAENIYFGKPCGLMDQIACGVGGLVYIDFKDPSKPVIEKITVNLDDYSAVIVKTVGNHSNLTDQYASIPLEMKCAASVFGREFLRGVSLEGLISQIDAIREKCGDRGFLRALHFVAENERVEKQKRALKQGELEYFMKLVSESGLSSWKYLQNVTVQGETESQEMAVVLALTEEFIKDKTRGAVRVHGGGFGGTILSFIHRDDQREYVKYIEKVTGKGSASVLTIRETGVKTFPLDFNCG